MKINKDSFTEEVVQIIDTAFRHGNTVELKVEKGNLVVVEIERKVKTKQTIIG